MSFRKLTTRIFLLLIIITMAMYALISLLVEHDASHPATNVWKITHPVRLMPNVLESVHSFLSQSPLDDELLQLQLPLVRLVKYFGFPFSRELTVQSKIWEGKIIYIEG